MELFKQIFSFMQESGIVKLLLEKGANINAKTKNNEAALLWAVTDGNFSIERSNNDQKL